MPHVGKLLLADFTHEQERLVFGNVEKLHFFQGVQMGMLLQARRDKTLDNLDFHFFLPEVDLSNHHS